MLQNETVKRQRSWKSYWDPYLQRITYRCPKGDIFVDPENPLFQIATSNLKLKLQKFGLDKCLARLQARLDNPPPPPSFIDGRIGSIPTDKLKNKAACRFNQNRTRRAYHRKVQSAQ